MLPFSLLKNLAILYQIIEASSHLLVTPEDVTAETGGRASFNCCTSLDEGIRWMYATEENSDMLDHIYSGGFTYAQWRKRHIVTESDTGCFTLIIEPIVKDDAGFYSCMDIKDDSFHEAKLVVTYIHEWVTTDSLSEFHTSEHSIIYKRSSELVTFAGIVVFCLLMATCMMVALYKSALHFALYFKSGKLFGEANQNGNRHFIICVSPIHIKYLLATYFKYRRNSRDDCEATNWLALSKETETCTTQNEEIIYMITI